MSKRVIIYTRPWIANGAGLDELQIQTQSANTHRNLKSEASALIDRLKNLNTERLYVK